MKLQKFENVDVIASLRSHNETEHRFLSERF